MPLSSPYVLIGSLAPYRLHRALASWASSNLTFLAAILTCPCRYRCLARWSSFEVLDCARRLITSSKDNLSTSHVQGFDWRILRLCVILVNAHRLARFSVAISGLKVSFAALPPLDAFCCSYSRFQPSVSAATFCTPMYSGDVSARPSTSLTCQIFVPGSR